ncbi:MAG: hypothetical protein EAX96_00205 [Candidatus Lokiarchaeota archaeon]|nr:hypothetical protein [Candidatus Lokiarchaeota archaeon]
MKRKVTIPLAIFFSLLMIGVMGTNVVIAHGTAPAWHPINDDIADWDLRWEGALNDTFLWIDFDELYNTTGTSDAWGQIWTKNVSDTVNSCALVFMIDLGVNYWDTSIVPGSNTYIDILLNLLNSTFSDTPMPSPLTVWKLFYWFINSTMNFGYMGSTGAVSISDISTDPGFDHGLMINGTYDGIFISNRDIEFILATKGTGLTLGLSLEVNPQVIEYVLAMGIANVSNAIYGWLNNTYTYLAMIGMLTILMMYASMFSNIIGALINAGLLSVTSDLALSTATTTEYNQTALQNITSDTTEAAATKGFGGVSTTTTPPIPGFEMLFILIPLMVILSYYGLAKKRKAELLT